MVRTCVVTSLTAFSPALRCFPQGLWGSQWSGEDRGWQLELPKDSRGEHDSCLLVVFVERGCDEPLTGGLRGRRRLGGHFDAKDLLKRFRGNGTSASRKLKDRTPMHPTHPSEPEDSCRPSNALFAPLKGTAAGASGVILQDEGQREREMESGS